MKFIKKILRLLILDLFKLFKVASLVKVETRGLVLVMLNDTETEDLSASLDVEGYHRPLDSVGEFDTSQDWRYSSFSLLEVFELYQ